VASGIANDGVVMRPFVIGEINDNAGSISARTSPRRLTTACDKTTADQVEALMVDTVNAGSGARAQLQGVKVAGKTGTAETGKSTTTDAWFIAFAPAEDPVVALAVLIEQGGIGGQIAAPTARPVLEAALRAQGESR
ncbi:MAG TPA: penicillin-binding transpeptidase domain-containing protein, partial [Coriobacteriia bacterium]|nr:penicillin-binding transpeptidase domain-containing protein [Coriobacteriia bacterium]